MASSSGHALLSVPALRRAGAQRKVDFCGSQSSTRLGPLILGQHMIRRQDGKAGAVLRLCLLILDRTCVYLRVPPVSPLPETTLLICHVQHLAARKSPRFCEDSCPGHKPRPCKALHVLWRLCALPRFIKVKAPVGQEKFTHRPRRPKQIKSSSGPVIIRGLL